MSSIFATAFHAQKRDDDQSSRGIGSGAALAPSGMMPGGDAKQMPAAVPARNRARPNRSENTEDFASSKAGRHAVIKTMHFVRLFKVRCVRHRPARVISA